ncbi:MAG: lanthionine synthetase C family protein [Lewinellaceae bacterium]|nr:lanthionine synthetase C family protein [Lewinellaceae bacterium]
MKSSVTDITGTLTVWFAGCFLGHRTPDFTGILSIRDIREVMGEFDDYPATKMTADAAEDNYDFLHGAVGTAHYLLQYRRQNPLVVTHLEQLVDGLEQKAVPVGATALKWDFMKSEAGESNINISLSHGMSGIAVLLSKMVGARIAVEKSTDLLQKTIHYLLSQEVDPQKYVSCFPSRSLESDKRYYYSRLSWCYGDLGVALALYYAGVTLRAENWRRKAIDILIYNSTRKDLRANSVHDAGICHGASGIAHIFQRMYIETKLPVFREAAVYWYGITLDFGNDPEGLAGYVKHQPAVEEPVASTDFLEGISGIGLSLIHAISDIPPTWDECLFIS